MIGQAFPRLASTTDERFFFFLSVVVFIAHLVYSFLFGCQSNFKKYTLPLSEIPNTPLTLSLKQRHGSKGWTQNRHLAFNKHTITWTRTVYTLGWRGAHKFLGRTTATWFLNPHQNQEIARRWKVKTNTWTYTQVPVSLLTTMMYHRPCWVCFRSDAGWLHKNQKSLQRFITAPLLGDIVNHMRKSDELSAEGAGIIKEAGSSEDKVHALIELLCRGDPQGTALQAYLQNSHPEEYNLITLHGECMQGQLPYSEWMI